MRNDTGRFLSLAHEKLNKIKDFNISSGPAMTIDFAPKNALVEAVTALFETAWGRRRTQ